MATLQLRRPPFQFDESTPFQWNPANPLQGLAMNSVTFIAPAFERYIVATVRKAMPQITDPAVREEADLFLRQEAVHARAHRNHAAALVGQYPGLAEMVTAMDSSFDRLLESRPLRYHLAYVADIEATFTPIFDLLLRHRDTLFDNGDHRVAPLFLWHFVEEIEHRCSALNIYNAVVSSPWYRLRVAPSVFRHMRHLQRLTLRGYKAHVPVADWGFDPADLDGGGRFVRALKGQKKPDALSAVPLRDKLSALYRFARSQWPGHSPATEQTPPFANEWLRAYDEGRDVVRWYAGDGAGA